MAQTLLHGERYYFATFTIPNPELSLTETRSIVARAWTLFRKRKLCVSLIRGGSKSEEFTVTAKGFHYHLHCLFLSKWLSYQEIRRNWTECVEIAFKEHGRSYTCNNSDGLLRVVVKPVTINEGLYHELCKYLTKSDSWSKMPKTDLLEIAMIRKWSRMFELFGSFRTAAIDTLARDVPIVHTRPSNDGDPRAVASYWRDRIASMTTDDYAADLLDEFHRCVNGRLRQLETRYKDCRIITYAEILLARAHP